MSRSKDNNYSREYAPCFILEDKYFEQLRTPKQIALYSFLARTAYREIPFSEIDFAGFCKPMGISADEVKATMEYFHKIGFLTKGN
jgi:hypothetical protein